MKHSFKAKRTALWGFGLQVRPIKKTNLETIMKVSLPRLGLLTACVASTLFAMPTHAQTGTAGTNVGSNNTIYGSIAVGTMWINNVNGGKQTRMLDNDHWATAIGFRGREDLGSGLFAVYLLETNFRMTTGAIGGGGGCTQLFCKSFVGLSHRDYGQITLGRQVDTTLDLLRYTTAMYTTELAFHPGAYDRQPIIGVNNAIRYESPIFGGGLQAKALYALHEAPATGQSQTGRTASLSLKYQNGPFSAAAATTHIRDTLIRPWNTVGGLGLPSGTFWGVTGTTNTPTPVPLRSQNIYGIGADYKMGKTTLFGSASTVRMEAAGGQTGSVKTVDFGVAHFIQPNLQTSIGYFNSRFAAADAKWHNVSASLDYFLSKRTDVYLLTSYQKASGTPNAQNYFVGPSSDQSQLGIGVGIRHYF